MTDRPASRPPASDSIDDEFAGVTPPLAQEEPETWGWTRTHRIGIGVLLIACIAILVVGFLRRPANRNDPILVINGQPTSLPVNIDPNTADAASLSRIPGIGEKTAKAIVAYREVHRPDTPDGIVFRRLVDIEPALGRQASQAKKACRTYMVFPDEPPPSPRGLKPAEVIPEGTVAEDPESPDE